MAKPAKPKAKRKRRSMRADLRPVADKIAATIPDMPFVPDIELPPSNEWEKRGDIDAPYDNRPDKDRWWALFFTMLGTRQAAVVDMFLGQLQKLVPDKWDDKNGCWRGNQEETRAMFGMIQSMKPKTVAQAAYAAQLVALHFNTMKLAAGISSYSMGDARTAATMARCTKAYGEGLLVLQKLQGKVRKTKQTIKVETHHHHHQHLHVEGGGSEFGGRVHAASAGSGSENSPGTSLIEAIPALPGEGPPHRQALPVASGKGQARLPDARGRKGKRRTEG
jgi:hypothetical protein